MRIGEKLKNILDQNSSNPICEKLIKLSKNTRWINNISYLDIAIENPNKISYVSRDRVELFKKKKNSTNNYAEIFKLGERVKIKPKSIYSYQNYGIGEIYEINSFDLYDEDRHIYKVRFDGGYSNLYRHNDLVLESRYKLTLSVLLFNKDLRLKLAYMVSPGKLINKLGLQFSQKEVDDFSRLFCADIMELSSLGMKFEIYKGDYIKDIYHEDNYYDDDGTLGNSCMRYDDCQSYFDIYTENPQVSILALMRKSGNDYKVTGRALVWQCKRGNNDIILMDRIYVNNDRDVELFWKYAKKNGWWRKARNNASSKTEIIDPEDDKAYYTKLYVYLDRYDFDEYPYMDTFTYLSENGTLSNNDDGYWRRLESTGGDYDNGIETVYSEYYDEEIPEDEAYYSEYLNDHIWANRAVDVRRTTKYGVSWFNMPEDHEDICCTIDGYYLKEDCCYSEYHDEYLLTEDAIYSDRESDYFKEEDVIYIDSISDYVLCSDAVYSDYYSEYILKDDATEVDGTWIKNDYLDEYLESIKESEVEVVE